MWSDALKYFAWHKHGRFLLSWKCWITSKPFDPMGSHMILLSVDTGWKLNISKKALSDIIVLLDVEKGCTVWTTAYRLLLNHLKRQEDTTIKKYDCLSTVSQRNHRHAATWGIHITTPNIDDGFYFLILLFPIYHSNNYNCLKDVSVCKVYACMM